MGNLIKLLPKYFTLVVLLITLLGNCLQVESSADADFSSYLKTAMNNYTSWMKTNQLDPSPPTENSMVSGMYDNTHVVFNCILSNHRVIGLSDLAYESDSGSTFSQHNFRMGWVSNGAYESVGNFNCNGALLAKSYPGLSYDIAFSGQGTFRIAQNYSIESLTMLNVGITRDYKLDLSRASPFSELDAYQLSVQLQVQWSDPRIAGQYFNEVQERFGILYQNYPFFYDDTPSFPSLQLLNRYVEKIAQEVDLRQIIDESELPEPYVPTLKASMAERKHARTGGRAAI